MAGNYKHFVCVVAGDDYKSLIKPYDSMDETEYRIVYKLKDAPFLRDKYIELYEAMSQSDELDNRYKEDALEALKTAKEQTPEEFFYDFTIDYEYDDEGNAISNKNPMGKYSYYAIGQLFSVPFILNDGKTSFTAKKKDIDWSKMHGNNVEVYEAAWDMVMGDKRPETDEEHIIYDNMKERQNYFESFGDRDTYVASSTAFWGYAFVSEKTGWIDMDDMGHQFTWMSNFYDTFISNLDDNTRLTIIECRK